MRRPPDILWIITTQWRAQATGCAGDPNLRADAHTRTPSRTPHLDALARDPHTINCAQAVTPHPFGPFARAAMLTGVPSPENGVRDYYDPLPADTRTIAHELRGRHHGYATSFFGKWHLARRDPRAPPVGDAHARTIVPPEARGGFDFWEGFESGFLLNDPWLHGTRLPEPRQFHGYQSDVLCGRASEYLRARENAAPRFCVVSLEAPHPPYAAPTPQKNQERGSPAPRSIHGIHDIRGVHGVRDIRGGRGVRGIRDIRGVHGIHGVRGVHGVHGVRGVRGIRDIRDIHDADPQFRAPDLTLPANVPLGGEVEAQARRELAGYYAHIEATDAAIGRLIAGMRAQNPNTLIVFTSVHGDMHGAHGLFRKGWPYEESVRVPLLVNHPSLRGEKNNSAVSLIDLPEMTLSFVASFVARAGNLHSGHAGCQSAPLKPAPFKSAPLKPTADKPTGWNPVPRKTHARISMPSVVRLPHQCDRMWRGVRTPARKLVLNEDGSPWLFFDLENDPLEMRNLAGDVSRASEIATLRTCVEGEAPRRRRQDA
ncbi:MAG: sulfatase-like hydrolase/transferase [Opitutaceae bacterium]|jgi:arylsulfatase A-like enzyme|nr:sulfatase-like hydrolase/transferase [Opitutaceae bacterium]